MKERNPLFVAGFPYILGFIGYMGVEITSIFKPNATELSDYNIASILLFAAVMLVGVGYYLYWLIITARVLRRETGQSIPPAILLVIPFANYWWMWRYGQAVEHFTREKIQGVLAFAVIALTGPIGAGILQDTYNKRQSNQQNLVTKN